MQDKKSYVKICKKWHDYLGASPLNFVRIRRGLRNENGQWVRGEHPNKTTKIYARDVARAGFSHFQDYLDQLIKSERLKKITIKPMKDNGGGTIPATSHQLEDYIVEGRLNELLESKKVVTEVATKETMNEPSNLDNVQRPVNQESVSQAHHQSVVYPHAAPQNGLGAHVMGAMGGLGYAAQAAGLGLPQLIDLQTNDKLYKKLLEDYADLKKKYDLTEVENKTLKGQVEIAAQQKEVAIQLEQASKSGFFDSAAGQKMMEALPGIVEILGTKAVQSQSGLGAASSSLSQTKQNFIANYVNDNTVDDAIINLLSDIMTLMTVQGYAQELNTLNKKYGQLYSNQTD